MKPLSKFLTAPLLATACSGAPASSAVTAIPTRVDSKALFSALQRITPNQWNAFTERSIQQIYNSLLARASDEPVDLGGVVLANRRSHLLALETLVQDLDGRFGSYGAFLAANHLPFTMESATPEVIAAALPRFGVALKAFEQAQTDPQSGSGLGLISCESSGKFASSMLGFAANSADAVSGNFTRFVVDRVNMQALPSREHWFPGIPVLTDVWNMGTNAVVGSLEGILYGGVYLGNAAAGCANPGGKEAGGKEDGKGGQIPPSPAPKSSASCQTSERAVGETDTSASGCIESD